MAFYNEERQGQSPKVSGAGGGSLVVDWSHEPNSMQRTSGILSTILATIEEEETKKLKKQEEKFSLYKVLREAGYDTKSAYEAMQRGETPSTPPSSTAADTKAAADLAKTEADTAKAEAETAKIKKETEDAGKPLPKGFVRVDGKAVRDPTYKAPRKRSAAEAKMIAQSEALVNSLGQLETMVGTKDENYWPFGGGSEGAQQFQTLRDDIKSTLLYLRSGAAVTPQEYARLARLLPQLFRMKNVDKAQLRRFKGEFQTILDELKVGKRQPKAGFEGHIPAEEDSGGVEVFASEEEALASGLPAGTTVEINGRRFVLEDDEEA